MGDVAKAQAKEGELFWRRGNPDPEKHRQNRRPYKHKIRNRVNQKIHKSVLAKEIIELLDPQDGDIVVDGTYGFGGHSFLILEKIGPKGRLIAFEKDKEILDQNSNNDKRITFINDDFRNIQSCLNEIGVNKIDKALFDLGLSSYHFDSSQRGFSFSRDESLDMRLSDVSGVMAKDLVNGLSQNELADMIYQLSDEPKSRQIAKEIVDSRRKAKIETTGDLLDIISRVKGSQKSKINPATKTFQALRIAVNDEIGAIEDVVPQVIGLLKKNGRVAFISFHSGEDRAVKNGFKKFIELEEIKSLSKKPIVPQDDELRENPRSRSAKLRVVERIK